MVNKKKNNTFLKVLGIIVNIILYIIGICFIIGYIYELKESIIAGIFGILFGLSLFQIIYKIIEKKTNINKKVLVLLRIIVPIALIIIVGITIPSEIKESSNINKTNVVEREKQTEDNQQELVEVEVKKEKVNKKESSSNEKKKEYEFDDINGYTTLQSLIINIKDKTKLKTVKKMAYYCDYFIRSMPTTEYDGSVYRIINSPDEYNYTESVIVFYEWVSLFKTKLDEIEYSTNKYTYYYYADDHSRSYVSGPNSERVNIDNFKDAFKYINERIGYTE